MSGKHGYSENSSQYMVCKDGRIYAVFCQKVRLKTEKGQFATARLDRKPVWISYQKKRSGHTLTVASIGEDGDKDDEESDEEEAVVVPGLTFETLQQE